MLIREATAGDVEDLARLIWLDSRASSPHSEEVAEFATELARWWTDQCTTHYAFVAEGADQRLVGMTWVAVQSRPPRPGNALRVAADIQTVFVSPQHRGEGLGSALVEAAARHAESLGAKRVTVSSRRRATTVYERLGFASSPQLLQRLSD